MTQRGPTLGSRACRRAIIHSNDGPPHPRRIHPMRHATNDRPRLVVFPPVILLLVLGLSTALQWLAPLGVLTRFDQTSRGVGGGVLLVGAAFAWTGARTLLRRGTNFIPTRPALALATDGIYAWTR